MVSAKRSFADAENTLATGGTYSVHNSEFLTGANISVCLTKDFMDAVENDAEYELRFPDVEAYTPEEMKALQRRMASSWRCS